ncbi:lytic murein transglycosylase B [Halarcobacter anaerophilus]|jgi:membrane-bound lytic murein transglycosylase B|uniref:Lytic murein transglycosylase B n=1 Tax=Halarcobacter anaerophilus TaxID=877500 RepID=A0A4V1LQ33_9BACT|nr:lytic murein transglycosylase B [Halarcobacter anaerophilus]QDF28573.1 membrane-bound lytic murein transglycosylase B [Halarcobacter anaerophilus]RXJ63298.1 lytic murein transglycosylase B [Halarcobacter anaerophilus]
MYRKIFSIVILFFLPTLLFSENKNYYKNKEVKKFIKTLEKEHGFNKENLKKLFSKVEIQKSALKQYQPSKKRVKKVKKTERKAGSWDRYEKMFLSAKRVKKGVLFMKKYKKSLNKAYKIYGVLPEYITAIIGIETFYGKNTGRYPVFDTLTTLAFEKNRRNRFFKNELKEFLILSKKNKENPKAVFGSYAGAIGLAQFMPSNFKKLAVDFDNDGVIDLNNVVDAIGSVANYFKKAGWSKHIPVATRVSYIGKRFNRLKTGYQYKYKRSHLNGIKPKSGKFYYAKKVHLIKLDRKKYDELWYGTKNFYVITRYNRSNYYAMAIHKLAEKIKKRYKRLII